MNQITLPVAELKHALAGLSKVVSRKSTLPVLQTVRLSRNPEGRVSLSATDLDAFVTYHVEQSQPGKSVDVLLPYEQLNKSVRGTHGEVIVIPETKNSVKLRYQIGESPLEQSVSTIAAEEFPPTPNVTQPGVKMPENFGETLRQAFETSSTDSTRYVLQGAYLDVQEPNCHTIVSTNGRALFAANTFKFDLKEPVNIPRQKFLCWSGFLDGECLLAVKTDKSSPGWVQLTTPSWNCIVKQIEGQFPKWRQVVPQDTETWTKVRLSEAAIAQMLNLSSKLPGDDTEHRTLQLRVDRELYLEGRNKDDKEFTSAVIAGATVTGKPVLAALNREYLQNALRCGLDEIRIDNELSPLVFCRPGIRMVVMPVRLLGSPADATSKTAPAPQTTSTPAPASKPAEERKNTMPETTKSAEPSALDKVESIKTKLRELLGDLNDLTGLLKQADTAGALGNGERVWILAKLPGYIRVAGDDITEKYLLLSNSHDGKSSVTIKFTPVRVVCQNTLTLALNDGSAWRVSHHSDIHQKLKQACEMLGLIKTRFADMEQSFQAMSRVKLDSNHLTEYLTAVYPDQNEPDKQLLVQRDRNWSEYFFDQGKGNRMAGVAGSLWAGFNGVTEWMDHRKTRQNSNQRLNSAWFGESARIKARAFSVAESWLN